MRYAHGAWLPLGAAQFSAAAPGVPEGFVRGQPVQLYRLGPVYTSDGEHLLTFTEEMLAETVKVFQALKGRQTVPIDWNHSTASVDLPESGVVTLGYVEDLIQVPGRGLWAVPVYSPRGAEIVRNNPGALFTSPDFIAHGKIHDGTTGEMVGTAHLRAMALTPTPQQDRLDFVQLSTAAASRGVSTTAAIGREGVTMDPQSNPTAPPAAPPAQLADMPPAPGADPQAMPSSPEEWAAKVKALEEENAALKAKIAAMEAEYMSAKPQAAEVVAMSRQLSAMKSDAAQAAKRIADLEAANAQANLDRELDAYESRGLFAPQRRQFMADLHKAGVHLFRQEIARLEKSPEVPLGARLTHGAEVVAQAERPDVAFNAGVLKFCAANNIDPVKGYRDGMTRFRATDEGRKLFAAIGGAK